MTRILIAAAVIVVSFTVIALAGNTDFFNDLARDPSRALKQFFTYLAQAFNVMFS